MGLFFLLILLLTIVLVVARGRFYGEMAISAVVIFGIIVLAIILGLLIVS